MFGRCVRRTIAFENGPGLCGGMFIGNPFTDVTDLCSNVLLTADGEQAGAVNEAISIANEFWEMREHLQQPLTSLEESVRIAAAARGRIVLVDAADATSSGASGDSNAIARELVRIGCMRTALIPVVDAPAVHAAFRAGVGQQVTTPIGGTLDPERYTPLLVEGRVRLLSDGELVSESHGERWFAGPSAVIESGPITYVLSSRPVSLYDRTLFLANGRHPHDFDMTVVKSPHCQPRFFAEGAELLINVDAPGSTSANLPYLGHRQCRRPVFPLDQGIEFKPEARVFRRGR
jgi:microcystin degradation protein MlrC